MRVVTNGLTIYLKASQKVNKATRVWNVLFVVLFVHVGGMHVCELGYMEELNVPKKICLKYLILTAP